MAQQSGSRIVPGPEDPSSSPQGKVDLVSMLYIAGGIPAILAFLVLLFAVGVRVCGLPA